MKPRPSYSWRGAALTHPLFLVFLISLTVPLYFLLLGYFGDDYSFHLSSWMGIVEGWHSGLLAPAWLANANFGLGEPRFYFYPPFSVYLGATLLSILPDRIVPALMPWLSVLLAGTSMLKLAHHLTPARAAQSALLYCTSFYLVITIVMRYAIAEAFVAAILPLTVLYALRLLLEDRTLISVKFTILLASAWLTNIPAALVVFYIFLFGTAFLAFKQRSLRPVILYLLAQGLAVGLCAWYLLPALFAQKQLTTIGLAAKFPWRSYTLLQHPHNPLARSLTYPLWIWAIAGFAFLLCFAVKQSRNQITPNATHNAWYFIATLGCLPIFFELPESGLLWNHLPELKLVAFSFRFLPFVAIALSLTLPQIRSANLRRLAYILWFLWMLMPVAERIGRSHVHGAPEPFAVTIAQLRQGTGGMGEYLPAGIATGPESQAVADASHSNQTCITTTRTSQPQAKIIESHNPQPCLYQPGLFYFPEWHATLDGQSIPIQRSPTGQVQLALPAGDHSLTLIFERPRGPLLLGVALTLLAILLLFAGSRLQQKTTSLNDVA